MKYLALAALFFGEAFCIWAEMVLAATGRWSVWPLLVLVLGALGLSCGYLYGTKYFGDIWVVCLVSTAGIVISEPILAYLYFNSFPDMRTMVGLLLCVAGLIVTIR